MNRLYFGGLLATALLGLYIYAIVYTINFANHCSGACQLGESVSLLLQTIGALVSAVVVSELAVTSPSEPPGSQIANAVPAANRNAVTWLASAYLVIWLASGLVLVLFGWVKHENSVPQLASAAKEWLGFAIASGYAYFGVTPDHH